MPTKLTRSLVLVTILSVAAAQAQTKLKAGFNLFSTSDDVQIGQQSAVQAEQQLPLLNDSQVNAYVNRIGQRLAQNAGGPNFQYQFHVVNQSDINAFALPGGYVFVNRGVLDNAKNEGEVAGVLAHEISHVSLRHGTHQASKAYLAQAGISILGGLLGGRVGQNTAQILNTVGGLGLNALFLKYSRDLETEADVRGSQILTASGYSPVDMVNFFQTLESVDKSKSTNWLSDHPAPPDRIARIQKEATLLHVSQTPTENVADLRAVKSRLNSLGPARSAQQIAQQAATNGRTSGRSGPMSSSSQTINVPAPSSSLRTYQKDGLYQIGYPSNWQVYESQGSGVTIAPPGGAGNVNGNSEIVYGAIVNHYDPTQNGTYRNVSLQQGTQELVSALEQASPYLKPISNNGQRLRLTNGDTGIAVALRGTDPVTGLQERVTVVTRQLGDGHLLYVLFVTPERDAANYSNVLNQMVSTLQVNTNQPH
jgi:Zn-dependent protease with chaperone function